MQKLGWQAQFTAEFVRQEQDENSLQFSDVST